MSFVTANNSFKFPMKFGKVLLVMSYTPSSLIKNKLEWSVQKQDSKIARVAVEYANILLNYIP